MMHIKGGAARLVCDLELQRLSRISPTSAHVRLKLKLTCDHAQVVGICKRHQTACSVSG